MSSIPAGHVKTTAEPSPPAAKTSLFLRLQPFLFPALLIVLTIAAYAQVYSNGFIEAYDDEEFVTKNSIVMQGMTWHGFTWSFTSFLTGNWHPLTWWSHMADAALFGLNPVGHHATSLALHVINTVLLYYFLLRTTGFRGRSFLVAALFALHPLHVESVAWVAERKDLLSTAFGLIALHLYTHYVRTRRMSFYLAMYALLCLSLMAKPMLVTFPFLLLVLDYWPLDRFREQSFLSLVREKLPLLVPVLAISAVTLEAQKSVGAIADRPLLARAYSALDAYLVYLKKFIAPYDLSSFYPYVPISAPRALLAALVLTAVTLCVWRYRYRAAWLVTGWLWFIGLLIPVIGIIGVGTQAYADRYTYLPAVGLSIIAVWSCAGYLASAGFSGRIRTLSAAAVIVICALVTWNQVGYWKDGFSLYGRELEVDKSNWHAHLNLGNMLVDRKRYDEGLAHYREALINHPESKAKIYYNIGVAYERQGNRHLSQQNFRLTIQLAPDLDQGYLGLSRVLISRGDLAGALGVISEGLHKVSDNSMLLAKKAYLLHLMGNVHEAVEVYRQAIARAPGFEQNYVNLGILLSQQGNDADFAILVGQLRRINPDAADELAKLNK